MYQSFKNMPMILKFITVHAIACFIFFVAAVIPGTPITYNGEVMASQELWAHGVGLHIVAIGIAMPVMGMLFLQRWLYSRQLYSITFIFLMVFPFVLWQELYSAIFSAVISCVIITYLFLNRQACAYFSS